MRGGLGSGCCSGWGDWPEGGATSQSRKDSDFPAQDPPWLASAHLPAVPPLLAVASRRLPPHMNEKLQDRARLMHGGPQARELCLEKSLGLGIPEGEAAGQLGSAGSGSPRDTHRHRGAQVRALCMLGTVDPMLGPGV